MSTPTQRIEGVRPVLEAIRAGRRRVREVTLPDRERSAGVRELAELVRERGIPVRRDGGAGSVHALAEPFPEQALEDLLVAGGPRFWVALDRVTDVGNLGSIARSAETAGVHALVLEHRHSPPIGPGALRASAGALEHLSVARTPSLRRGLELARAEGIEVLAADAAGPPLAKLPPHLVMGDVLWVFGSEDRGLRSGIRDAASQVVGIPLHGHVASLSVSAAAAILLHQTAALRAGLSPAETGA